MFYDIVLNPNVDDLVAPVPKEPHTLLIALAAIFVVLVVGVSIFAYRKLKAPGKIPNAG